MPQNTVQAPPGVASVVSKGLQDVPTWGCPMIIMMGAKPIMCHLSDLGPPRLGEERSLSIHDRRGRTCQQVHTQVCSPPRPTPPTILTPSTLPFTPSLLLVLYSLAHFSPVCLSWVCLHISQVQGAGTSPWFTVSPALRTGLSHSRGSSKTLLSRPVPAVPPPSDCGILKEPVSLRVLMGPVQRSLPPGI